MDTVWTRFLDGSASASHGVQVYADTDELADSVATYLAAGLQAGEPAIVVATAEHAEAFQRRLAGFDESLLFVADAGSTLESIVEDGRLSKARFEHVIVTLLDDVGERFPSRRIRSSARWSTCSASAVGPMSQRRSRCS